MSVQLGKLIGKEWTWTDIYFTAHAKINSRWIILKPRVLCSWSWGRQTCVVVVFVFEITPEALNKKTDTLNSSKYKISAHYEFSFISDRIQRGRWNSSETVSVWTEETGLTSFAQFSIVIGSGNWDLG